MRSVFVLLRETTESEVEAHLNRTYPSQREPWVMLVNGDAHLYICFYRDGPSQHEPEEWANIVQQFGGEPAVSVGADVSGRHPGDEQVAEFVADLLTRFSGAAMDDYTDHLGLSPNCGRVTGSQGTRSSTTKAGTPTGTGRLTIMAWSPRSRTSNRCSRSPAAAARVMGETW